MFKQALTILALTGVLAAGPSFAHAKLLSSSPANNAQLTLAPQSLTLKFSEAAQLAMLKLTTAGKDIPVVFDKSAKANESFAITLPALSPGKYTLQWSAIAADDGHVTKGSFVFTIAG